MSKRILFFDTETTGLPKSYKAPVEDKENYPDVVQLAYSITDENGVVLKTSMRIVQAIQPISKGASDVHGITPEISAKGSSPVVTFLEFLSDLSEVDLLVAHNFNFDSKVMASQAYRLNFNDISASIYYKDVLDIPHLDTMLASTEYCKLPGKYGKYKWAKLQELHTILFGENFEGAHDALADINATIRCYFELIKLGVINKI